jgi:hypothetical protein
VYIFILRKMGVFILPRPWLRGPNGGPPGESHAAPPKLSPLSNQNLKDNQRQSGEIAMFQSHVIEIRGVFVGAALIYSGKFRFVAIDPRAEELDGSEWPSLPDIRRVVGHLLSTGRLPAAEQGYSAAAESAARPPVRLNPS